MQPWMPALGLLGLFLLWSPDSLHAFKAACDANEDSEDRDECEEEERQQREQDEESDAAAEAELRALDEALEEAVAPENDEEEELPEWFKTPDGPQLPLNEPAHDIATCTTKTVTRYATRLVEDCWVETVAMASTCAGAVKKPSWESGSGCAATVGSVLKCVTKEVEEEIEEKVEECEE